MNYSFNKIRKTVAIYMIGAATFSVNAQNAENLVPNGGFESVARAPKKLGSIEDATGWVSPTGVRADLFTPNRKVPDINAPDNLFGREDAREGSNYAGFVAFSYGGKMPRSYLTNKLSVPMKKGTKYCVKFEVSMAEGSKYACNQIGMMISKNAPGTEEKVSIIEQASVLHQTNKIFNGTFGWQEVCGVYEAQGGERFITIGNFSSDANTKNERNKKQTDVKATLVIAAYYYIDNVSITLVDDDHPCSCASEDEDNNYSRTVYQRAAKVREDMTAREKIEAQAIHFGFGKNELTQAAEEALDVIAEQMKLDPSMRLQIKAYSDALEDEVGAQKVAYSGMDSKRANAVVLYLVGKGIAESRLMASPQGSDVASPEILETDESDIKEAKNRRVEFKVR